MGVFHFMGLGRAVGAISCAVDYIERALDASESATPEQDVVRLFGGSGGLNHEETNKGKIEGLVLFTSKEVIGGELQAFPYNGCESPGSVRDEIEKVLRGVWKRADADEGRKIYWCEVDIDNFRDCFDKIVRVAYRFSPQGKQGKEIWCNLTGGSNTIGYALLSMARLTGLSNKHYVISQRRAFQKEIRVPSQIRISPNHDGYFNIVPFIRTQIDTIAVYDILLELQGLNKAVSTDELFGRLRGKGILQDVQDPKRFVRNYMLKLFGLGYTTFDADTNECGLSPQGHQFLDEELPELEAAIEFGQKIQQDGVDLVAMSREWDWFSGGYSL